MLHSFHYAFGNLNSGGKLEPFDHEATSTHCGGTMKFIKNLAAFALFIPALSFACSFDVDCSPGSKCMKARGDIYGVCAGGLFPGNNNDRQPVRAPLDINQTYGNTCSFDIDCGPGSKCLKDRGAIDGVCVRGR